MGVTLYFFWHKARVKKQRENYLSIFNNKTDLMDGRSKFPFLLFFHSQVHISIHWRPWNSVVWDEPFEFMTQGPRTKDPWEPAVSLIKAFLELPVRKKIVFVIQTVKKKIIPNKWEVFQAFWSPFFLAINVSLDQIF